MMDTAPSAISRVAQARDVERELEEAAPILARQLSGSGSLHDDGTFAALLRPGLLRAVVERDLQRFADGQPFATKNAPPGHLRIYTSDELSIRALIVPAASPRSRTIATLTRDTFVGNAGRTPFVLRRYRLPPGSANEIFDPARHLEEGEEARLEPGASVGLRAGIEAYDVVPEERVAIAMTAYGPPLVPIAWRFNRATLRPVRAEPARTAWARVLELLAFAGMVGDASLLPALDEAVEHPSHFVRWAAAKTACRVAPDGGRAFLTRLVEDPHPQLRAGARTLLAQMAAS